MQGALKPEDLSRLRLVHDLKEVVSQPLPDVTALPVEHNIYEWHGNVRSSDGSFGGASVHFLLVFPQDYPRSPPECRLFTPVPHPNVSPATTAIPGAREARWRLALFDCVLNHSTWSCAYSVQSVLVQLQAFLLDEDLQFATSKVAPEEAVRQARAFTCPCQGCTHAPKKPSPAFLTPEQCAAASGGRAARVPQVASGASSSSAPAGLLAVEFVPAAKRPGAEALTMHQRPRGGAATAPAAAVGPKTPGGGAAASAAATPVKGSPAGSAASKSSAAASVASGSKAGSSKASGGGSSNVASDEEEWVEVQGKKKKKQPSSIMPPSWTSHHHHHHHGKSTATSSAISNNSSTNAAATVAGAGAAAGAAAVAAGPSSSSAGAVWGNAFGALLTKEAKVLTKAMLKGKELSFESLPASGAGQQQQQQQGQQQQGVQQQLQGEPEKPGVAALGGAKAPLSKAAKKNAARAEKRKAKKGQVEEQQASPAAAAAAAGQPAAPSSAAATAAPATATATSKGPAVGVNGSAGTGPSVAAGEDGWTGVKGKGKGTPAEATDAGAAAAAGAVAAPPNLLQQVHELRNRSHHQLIKAVYREAADEAAAAAAAAVPSAAGSAVTMLTATPAATGSMGLLGCLPRDVMLEVLQLLKPSEVAVLAQASRGLTQACKDGQLWLALLQRHFPKSSLSHSQQSGDVSDLRHAFMLEAACVPDETRCFYSRAHYQSEVLGLPLRYTINPVTKVIDYIEVEPELMSVAVFAGGVDRTPAGERIDAVLPVYISAEHFARAQPALRKLLAKLGPSCTSSVLRNQPVGPETWLELIPAAMNTSAVLLSDKGVAASQRALNTYCMLHRLLLALCEQHGLWGAVSARLDHFLASPANRTKAACPNLGLIYPLLSLSPGHAWAQVAPALVSETFDRAVMWMCKSNLNLVDMFQNKKQQPGAGAGTSSGGTSGGYSDTDFLTAALNASVVSRRLLMFNVAFLRLVACPPGVRLESVMDSYDALLGRPGAGLLARFQRHVTRILAANSWTEFFALAGLRCPEPPALVAMLRRAWQEGVRKKYHSKDTNFAAIQSRGVSKILLKGETYSAPPGMRTITMEERWRWRPEDGTKFLDASCLLFDAQGNFLEAIDYSHRTSSCTSVRGAVRHSGDVLDDGESSGLHTITINLADLGDQVSHFYVTMSSWAGAKLNEIEQPFVSVTDPSTGMDLCAYHLGSEALEARRTHSSVIMCKVHRAPGAPGQWRVKAIGQLGQGQARSYGPMLEKIRALPA